MDNVFIKYRHNDGYLKMTIEHDTEDSWTPDSLIAHLSSDGHPGVRVAFTAPNMGQYDECRRLAEQIDRIFDKKHPGRRRI